MSRDIERNVDPKGEVDEKLKAKWSMKAGEKAFFSPGLFEQTPAFAYVSLHTLDFEFFRLLGNVETRKTAVWKKKQTS